MKFMQYEDKSFPVKPGSGPHSDFSGQNNGAVYASRQVSYVAQDVARFMNPRTNSRLPRYMRVVPFYYPASRVCALHFPYELVHPSYRFVPGAETLENRGPDRYYKLLFPVMAMQEVEKKLPKPSKPLLSSEEVSARTAEITLVTASLKLLTKGRPAAVALGVLGVALTAANQLAHTKVSVSDDGTLSVEPSLSFDIGSSSFFATRAKAKAAFSQAAESREYDRQVTTKTIALLRRKIPQVKQANGHTGPTPPLKEVLTVMADEYTLPLSEKAEEENRGAYNSHRLFRYHAPEELRQIVVDALEEDAAAAKSTLKA